MAKGHKASADMRPNQSPPVQTHKPEQRHWRELLLAGIALLAEGLAVIFGVFPLTIGAAILLWFAVKDYRSKKLKTGSRKYRIAHGLISAVILLVLTTVIPIAVKNYRDTFLNGRHLNKAQVEGIKRLADANPPGIKIVIRTAGNSPEAQRYGKEIWNVLYFRNRNVIAPFIIAAAEEPPSGLEVLVSSGLGPAWEAAERFQFGLGQLGMPSLIHDGYWAATDKSFVLFVGLKPNHD